MEQRYRALRFVATLLKITAIFFAVISFFGALSICGIIFSGGIAIDRFAREFGGATSGLGMAAGIVGGAIASILPIVLGSSFALILYAVGEAVNLQIAIEENTRSAAWHIQNPVKLPVVTPIPAPPPPVFYEDEGNGKPLPPVVYQEERENGEPEPALITSTSEKKFCPQCGGKIIGTESNCTNCNYELSQI
jgi:hypothetical protein